MLGDVTVVNCRNLRRLRLLYCGLFSCGLFRLHWLRLRDFFAKKFVQLLLLGESIRGFLLEVSPCGELLRSFFRAPEG